MSIKKFYFVIVIVLTGLCILSCGGDDEDNFGEQSIITPSQNNESSKFVGVWEGRGPISSGNNIKSIPQGKWTFNSDGTYYWKANSNISGYSTSDSGHWHYNSQSKVLVTDSHLSINWQILDIGDDTWTGIMSYGSTNCTYRKVSE